MGAPAEPPRFTALIVAFHSKYTRYSSLTRLASRAPPRSRCSRHFIHGLLSVAEDAEPERDSGRFYEDFRVGQRIIHPLGRTVSTADNAWFSLLTQNQNPIHIDAHFSERTLFGKPLVNSCLTLALATGQSVHDLTRNAVANLGWEEVRLPAPLFEEDTLYSESEVLVARESRSRPEAGIVTVRTTGRNQEGTVVIEFRRTFLVWKRTCAPRP